MNLGGVARGAGGAERKSRGREGEKFLIYTGPEGNSGGESRLPLSLKTDGVFNRKQFFYWMAGASGDVCPFLREDMPLMQRSISWCAVARSCSC